MRVGRKQIFTDVEVITYENVLDVLQRAFPEHQINASEIDYLLEFDAGYQPILRDKKNRPEIDCECVDNVAHEITKFHTSFKWGNPITLVQRGEVDSGKKGESEAICLFNECYESEGIKRKTQKLARFVEVGAVSYTFVDVNMEWEEGDSYFNIQALNPRTAFLIHSSYYIDERPMLGVTYRTDSQGSRYFTCFSKDARFEIKNHKIMNGEIVEGEYWNHELRSGEKNPLNAIPIIEWFRSYDRMGCFEREISEMDNLNLLISDFSNDVEQNTQAIWHTNDVDFPEEIFMDEDGKEVKLVRKPKSTEWMQTFTSPDGKTPIVEALAIDYDYPGMLNNIVARRNLILQKAGVPQRNDNSGGSTGIAMDAATGWDSAEIDANQQQSIMESCKMKEVKVALKAIKISPFVPADSPLLNLKYTDMQPSIKRQKNFELTTKINFFATAVGHGIYGLHALKAMNTFEDVAQVWEDSKSLIEAYQKSVFEKSSEKQSVENQNVKPDADKLLPDESDQIGNSPLIDGIKTE